MHTSKLRSGWPQVRHMAGLEGRPSSALMPPLRTWPLLTADPLMCLTVPGTLDATLAFTVKHYAGAVTYLTPGFREKNKDLLHPDLAAVMQESASAFVRSLFPAAVAEAVATAGAGPQPA